MLLRSGHFCLKHKITICNLCINTVDIIKWYYIIMSVAQIIVIFMVTVGKRSAKSKSGNGLVIPLYIYNGCQPKVTRGSGGLTAYVAEPQLCVQVYTRLGCRHVQWWQVTTCLSKDNNVSITARWTIIVLILKLSDR